MQDTDTNIETVSVDTDLSNAPENAANENQTAPDASAPENEFQQKIDDLNNQISELNDKFLRTAAELDNTRRRAALDGQSLARSARIAIIEKILPVIDAVEAALKHNPTDEGILSMSRAIDGAFSQIGITKIESVGQTLNPQFHNAIQVVARTESDTTAPNTITQDLQTGYMFGDTVLRTAMVIVCK